MFICCAYSRYIIRVNTAIKVLWLPHTAELIIVSTRLYNPILLQIHFQKTDIFFFNNKEGED